MLRSYWLAFLFAACLVPGSAVLGNDRARVLLLSGMNNHDWRKTTPVLKESLETTGRFSVTVLERTETMTAALLEDFDVVVSSRERTVSEEPLGSGTDGARVDDEKSASP